MLAELTAHLNPPDRACAKLLAEQHLVNRGKKVCYQLSPGLQQGLRLSAIRVGKEVRSLEAAQIAEVIASARSRVSTPPVDGVTVRLDHGTLTFSGPRETDQRVLETAEIINSELERVFSRISHNSDPISRIEERRVLVRSIFALAAKAALDFAFHDSGAEVSGIAVAVAGSYNHAPLRHSDLDFLVLYKGGEQRRQAEAALSYLERICALTRLEASNIVRIYSSGKFACLELGDFACKGFQLFPGAVTVKAALLDTDCLEGVGDYHTFECFGRAANSHWCRAIDGERDAALLAKARGSGKPETAVALAETARWVEKTIYSALLLIKQQHLEIIDFRPDYSGLLNLYLAKGVITPRQAALLAEAVRASRVTCECLGGSGVALEEQAARELGLKDVKALRQAIGKYHNLANAFLSLAEKTRVVSEVALFIHSVIIDLRFLFAGLRRKYWYRDRQLRARVATSSNGIPTLSV